MNGKGELFGRLDLDQRSKSLIAGRLGSIFVLLIQLHVGQLAPNSGAYVHCSVSAWRGLPFGCADRVEHSLLVTR